MPNYPAPPGARMAWDVDGTVLVLASGTNPSLLSSPIPTDWNSETYTEHSLGITSAPVAFVFPEQRDIIGYFINGANMAGGIQTSNDTTNGADGTWTTQSGGYSLGGNYRQNIQAVSILGWKAIRFGLTANLNGGSQRPATFHLYGQPSAGQNPDRLMAWDPVLDQALSPGLIDVGDIQETVTTQKSLRIKNNSSTKTAHAVVVSEIVRTDASPSLTTQFKFSLDGTTWTSTVSLGDLAPGAISAVVNIRDAVAATAALGIWALRINATPSGGMS